MHNSTGVVEEQLGDQLSGASELALVSASQRGRHSAYAELCRRHKAVVYRAVRRITNTREDAEDAVQESLMKGYVHINSFCGRSAFSTWLTRIAINSALMAMRKRKRHKELSLDDRPESNAQAQLEMVETSDNPEEHCIREESLQAMRQAVRRLPLSLRNVVEIRQLQDVPLKEIAAIAGITVGATKSRLMRARNILHRPLRRN